MSENFEVFTENIFATISDRERLVLQHEVFKPNFLRVVERVLDEFGLAERLEAVKATNVTTDKVQILDVGCGEGFFLQDIANVLVSRGLLEASELTGFDIDSEAISSAKEFAQLAEPPKPYLNFYVADLTQPLFVSAPTEFDFICVTAVIEHIPDARVHLEKLYQALKPGGVLYVRAFSTEHGARGWSTPHPAFDPLYHPFVAFTTKKNPGIDVAYAAADWLKEWGAEKIETGQDTVKAGGETEAGMKMLHNWVMITRSSGGSLVKQGLVTQAQFEELISTLYRELSPQSSGHTTLVDTLARKPQP